MKMNEQQLFDAFEKVIDSKVYNKLKDTIVLHDGDSYRLFEKYEISQKDNVYLVAKMTSDTVQTFSSLKYAVTWATLDRNNAIYEANRLLELDLKVNLNEMYIGTLHSIFLLHNSGFSIQNIHFDKILQGPIGLPGKADHIFL